MCGVLSRQNHQSCFVHSKIPDRKITLLLPFNCTSLRSGLLYYRNTFYIVFSPIMSPTRPLNVAGKMFYHYYNFTIKETLKKIISAIKSILKTFRILQQLSWFWVLDLAFLDPALLVCIGSSCVIYY